MLRTPHNETYDTRAKRLKLAGYNDYKEYLASAEWTYINKLAQEKGLFNQCYICENRRAIVLHHLSYETIGTLSLDKIWAICGRHHKLIHDYAKKHQLSVDKASYFYLYGGEERPWKKTKKYRKTTPSIGKTDSTIMQRWLTIKNSQLDKQPQLV